MGRWLLLVLCGCGIDEAGQAQSSSDANAADVVDLTDGGAPDVQKEAAPPQACSVDAGACVASLPSGWDLVAFDPTNAAACPSNYASVAVVSNPQPQAGACDCACAVTTSPACDVGSLQRYISADTSCGQTGQLFTVAGGGCNVLGQTGGLSAYSKSSALAPNGGMCAGNIVKNKSAATTKAGTACRVPAACQEQFCGGDVPAGFGQCIVSSGTQSCPTGWGSATVVGDDFDFTCSSCSCDLNGTTCTNASLTFYTDTQCATSLVALAVDGQCAADPAAGQTPQAWEYKATLAVACNAAGAKTASNVQLANPQTICCK